MELLVSLLDAALVGVEGGGAAGVGVSAPLPPHSQVLLYLLASTMPYCCAALAATQTGLDFLARCLAAFTDLVATYSSPFNCGGAQAIFHAYAAPVDDDGNELTAEARGALTAGPPGAAAHDSLWDALLVATDVCRRAVGGDTACRYVQTPTLTVTITDTACRCGCLLSAAC